MIIRHFFDLQWNFSLSGENSLGRGRVRRDDGYYSPDRRYFGQRAIICPERLSRSTSALPRTFDVGEAPFASLDQDEMDIRSQIPLTQLNHSILEFPVKNGKQQSTLRFLFSPWWLNLKLTILHHKNQDQCRAISVPGERPLPREHCSDRKRQDRFQSLDGGSPSSLNDEGDGQ